MHLASHKTKKNSYSEALLMSNASRRQFFQTTLPLVLATSPWIRPAPLLSAPTPSPAETDEGITATEDLMREHGVIRRALLIYAALAVRLDKGENIPLSALGQTAELMRHFGEQYHEHSEEVSIFPVMKKAGKLVSLVDTLLDQHRRGHEITAYFLAVYKSGSSSALEKQALARQLWNFSRMYAHHAAREDTILFPALRQVLGPKQMSELGDRFEEEEKRILGEEGFEHSVARVGEIEATLGLADLSQFTAPPPPAAKPRTGHPKA
jgi:hemerythrin-like domain-containing protein